MWIAIISALAAVFVVGIVYLSFRAAHFTFIKKMTGDRKHLSRLVSFIILAAAAALLAAAFNVMNAAVCIIHLLVVWLLFDFVFFIVSKIRGKKTGENTVGAAALVFTFLYLCVGWYLAHDVNAVTYEITTKKNVGNLRIAQITDAHVGALFDAEKFAGYVDEISSENPDVVLVTGDFVDDDTSFEDMIGGCAALGRFRTKYGVYFVFGNHDVGYYSEELRGWGEADLKKHLEKNGVTVLEDEAVIIDGGFCIVGRRDRSYDRRGRARMTAEELASSIDKESFSVVMDHQPYDFDSEAEAGFDLVLCGHTHGGQLIPINHVGEWIGENCLRYGHEKRLGTDFIVSSGIGCWSIKFKTGCRSEYTIIDVEGSAGT